MDIDELLKKRKELQHRMDTFISQSISEFSRETGVGVRNISINMAEITTMTDLHAQHVLISVDITLDL